MALYEGAHYRVGYQGIFASWRRQRAGTADTDLRPYCYGGSLGDMLAQLPAWQQAENLTEIESVGSMRTWR